jgi:hypothetical protein
MFEAFKSKKTDVRLTLFNHNCGTEQPISKKDTR